MKKQFDNISQKLNQSAKENNAFISDNKALVDKVRNKKLRKKHSEDGSDSDSDLDDISIRSKKDNSRQRKAKNQLEVQYLHIEEKMAEIDHRLVKSYEVVQKLDEDTFTSLLKKRRRNI